MKLRYAELGRKEMRAVNHPHDQTEKQKQIYMQGMDAVNRPQNQIGYKLCCRYTLCIYIYTVLQIYTMSLWVRADENTRH
jgi:hypothetical protein